MSLKKKVTAEYIKFVLVAEEISLDSLVKLSEEVNIMLEDILDTCPLELPNTLCHMLDNQNVIDFKRHVELSNPLPPHTCDEEDENNSNLLGCIQTIFTRIFE
jgi:hypothetical protein